MSEPPPHHPVPSSPDRNTTKPWGLPAAVVAPVANMARAAPALGHLTATALHRALGGHSTPMGALIEDTVPNVPGFPAGRGVTWGESSGGVVESSWVAGLSDTF